MPAKRKTPPAVGGRFVLVYMTAGSIAEARRIGTALVRERLAACANILPRMESVYWWQGRIARGREAVLFLKTSATRVPALLRRAKQLHSYEVPCIVILPIRAGWPPFLKWITAETGHRSWGPGQLAGPALRNRRR